MNRVLFISFLSAMTMTLFVPSSSVAQVFELEYRGKNVYLNDVKGIGTSELFQFQKDLGRQMPGFFGAPVMVFTGTIDEFGRVVMVPSWYSYFYLMGSPDYTKKDPFPYRSSIPAVLIMEKFADDLEVSCAQRKKLQTVVDDYVSKRRKAYDDNPVPADYQNYTH